MKAFAALLLLFTLGLPRLDWAQSSTFQVGTTTVSVTPLVTNLHVPWELVWGPDDFIWMTERNGRISRVNPATGQVQLLLAVPDVSENAESGLLGMVLHPKFGLIPYVYVVYNYLDAGVLKEKLVRYTYSPTAGTLSSPLVLLGNITATSTHSGSRLLILPDLTLLMTTGDAQQQPEAQNRASLNGKILRLNLDGTIPSNNPTAGNPYFTLGHRNPQGLVQLPNGRIYSSEHGPDNDDEINKIEAGRNYGWPNVQGFCDLPAEMSFCSQNNVREPLTAWTPTIAPAGLAYYDHPAIADWRGSLLTVFLRGNELIQLPLNAAGDAILSRTAFLTTYGRLRSICVSPQGRVYVGTSNQDGRGNPTALDDQILVLENKAYVPTATTAAQTRSQLSLSPNPARQTVLLRLPVAAAHATTVEITDALGRLARTAQLPAGQLELAVSVSGLRPGVYIVHAQSGAQQYTQRLLVE